MRLLPALLATAALSAADTRPNIVCILLDDQGVHDAGWMGSRYYETPAMDRFAKQATVCTAGYSSGANCQPTRAALMSGQYAPRTGIYTVGEPARGDASRRRLVPAENRAELSPSVITWAEVLRDGGYATAHFGKWHLGSGKDTRPDNQGFLTAMLSSYGGHPHTYLAPWKECDLPAGKPGEHLTDALGDATVAWLRQQAGKGPFALNFWLNAVHSPIQPRPDDMAHFQGRAASGGQGDAAYAGLLLGADRVVGRVLDELDRLGLADNTLVVLTSDNGGLRPITDNAPQRGGKGMLYEGGIRVPLAFRWPGRIQAGSTCAQPILSMDLYASFLAVAGCKPPADQPCDGVDVLPALTTGAKLPREAVHWHLPCYLQGGKGTSDGRRDPQDVFRTRPAAAVRMGDLKLIEYFEDGGLELYDLAADPSESTNLAQAHPADAKRLHDEMLRWRTAVQAPVPSQPNPAFKP